jgi:hypothetical protein
MRALALAAALLAGSASAQELIYTDGALTVRLMLAPCRVPALVEGLGEVSPRPAREAIIKARGQEIPACWAEGEDRVFIGDVLGQGGYILKSELKAEPGV